jgi:hypothetical protein
MTDTSSLHGIGCKGGRHARAEAAYAAMYDPPDHDPKDLKDDAAAPAMGPHKFAVRIL